MRIVDRWLMLEMLKSSCLMMFLTYAGVLRCPSLHKHLISLVTWDKEGFRCIGKGGVLKLFKGPKIFLKGYIDNDGLYTPLGSTLISSICESTTSTKHGNGLMVILL